MVANDKIMHGAELRQGSPTVGSNMPAPQQS
jgi:hypothetical protein